MSPQVGTTESEEEDPGCAGGLEGERGCAQQEGEAGAERQWETAQKLDLGGTVSEVWTHSEPRGPGTRAWRSEALKETSAEPRACNASNLDWRRTRRGGVRVIA